ncbi:PREDICTED: uncharacterized protein LOC105557512 [Vollenhovia emeryi]|uniref:uncharacterized protein LOC105557512 n=1 Tax=Vollenhovia emeryi TaxID=411798 RepID=UPI0005F570FB|nr:PREDICTED: uncharacterized protein LOC105557512 [Vollenhovia emeryi]
MFLHSLAERGCGLGIVAEPYRIPKNSCWAGSEDGSAAIVWRKMGEWSTPVAKLKGGEGWVAVEWGPLVVVGVYLRPSLSRAELEVRLQELEEVVQEFLPGPVLVAGDFNAKSAMWGSRRPDCRGADVEDWATRLGLHLENTGAVSTCVRPQGESIVDLTWTSPAAARIVTSWEVMKEMELLSDHLPIEIKLAREGNRGGVQDCPLRWAVKKMKPEKLVESVVAAMWAQPDPLPSIEKEAKWLRRVMTAACDNAMPRAKFAPRRAAHWWSEQIAELRRSSVAARRAVLRARRRITASQETLDQLLKIYKRKRQDLRAAIRKAKEKAWEELLQSLDTDPWERPYKLVMNKLSTGAPPAVETLKPQLLNEVVYALFPRKPQGGIPPREEEDGEEHQQH